MQIIKKEFNGTEVSTIVDSENKTTYWVAKEVAKELGYIRNNGALEVADTDNMLNLIDDNYIINKNSLYRENVGKNILSSVHHKTKLITEAGLYQAIFSSQKPNAVKFRKWVLEEVIPSIMRDGYFISDNLQPQQETRLIKEVKTKYDRRFIDLEREEMIEFIKDYLVKEGLTSRQASSLLSDVYQTCHIAVSQKLASQIVFEHYKNGMDENSLETINTLRRVAKVYNTDFTSAINFYNESMLTKFGEYYSMILAKAKATITNHNRKPSVSLVKEAMIIESKSIIRLFSGLESGTKLKGVGRKKLNEAVKAYYKSGFIITLEDKENAVEAILRGESKSIKIK